MCFEDSFKKVKNLPAKLCARFGAEIKEPLRFDDDVIVEVEMSVKVVGEIEDLVRVDNCFVQTLTDGGPRIAGARCAAHTSCN